MEFFILNQEPIAERQAARVDALKAEGTKYGEAPHCETCGEFVGMRTWLPPLRVELVTWGQEFADLIITGTDLLVSSHFKHEWERSGLAGLSGFEDVEVVKLKRHRKLIDSLPRLFRAIVVRSRTAIDLAASEFEWGRAATCPACRLGNPIKRWKRIAIDRGTWAAEDIFIARGIPGEIIVSDRFKEFSERNKLKNAVFLPAEIYSRDFYPARTGPPVSVDSEAMVRIIGVHPVEVAQGCYLIEVETAEPSEPIDWGAVTQEKFGQPRAEIQVAYDEMPLDDQGTRWALFFHHLDFSRPLLTAVGSLELPALTPLPAHLQHLKYEKP